MNLEYNKINSQIGHQNICDVAILWCIYTAQLKTEISYPRLKKSKNKLLQQLLAVMSDACKIEQKKSHVVYTHQIVCATYVVNGCVCTHTIYKQDKIQLI